ncbi:hypothetical protein [Gemmatimonas sp. UBA7669]|uniref:hypothetical protein n=1 Tax=Gemmatimonas sp. UBA7669 TaxID=1946568 RepID=UPI0025C1AF45|nr:hypothetical protein [Gemmatimonas sp. UBA7669]
MTARKSGRKKVSRTSPRGAQGAATKIKRPYPRVPLKKALEVVAAIKDKNGGNPLEPALVAEYCNLSATNNDFVYLLSAASQFGLTTGTIRSQAIALTDFGRQLAYAGSPTEEEALKKQAFLNVDLFRRVLEHYRGSQLPELKYLGNTLTKQFDLPEPLHDEFSRVFRENAEHLGLSTYDGQSDSGGSGNGDQASHTATVVIGQPKKRTGKVCFVIMPFSERSGRYPAGFFLEVLNSLIIPAATEAGFEVRTANRQGTEIIHATIVNEVLGADLAICDLTEHNPNVLFELGMRLAHELPVALIHAEGTDRVFDVDNVLRVLAYSPNLWRTTIESDVPALKAHVEATWENREKNETYLGVLKKLRTAK